MAAKNLLLLADPSRCASVPLWLVQSVSSSLLSSGGVALRGTFADGLASAP